MNDSVSKLSMNELKLWVLAEIAASSNPVHKFNLIGRNGIGGPLDWRFGSVIGPEERALAVRAFDELKAADLIGRPIRIPLTRKAGSRSRMPADGP